MSTTSAGGRQRGAGPYLGTPLALRASMTKRRYSDPETQTILKRAAEISARGDAIARHVDEGSSLEELERIGDEAGLDVASVRRAALEVGERDDEGDAGRTGLRLTRDIDGTLDGAGRQAVLHEVRAHVPLAQVAPTSGSLLALASPFGTFASVATTGARTRVVLELNRRVAVQVPATTVAGVVLGSGLSLAALAAETLAQGAVIAGVGIGSAILTMAVVWLARPLDRAIKRRQEKHLARVLDDVAAVVREHARQE